MKTELTSRPVTPSLRHIRCTDYGVVTDPYGGTPSINPAALESNEGESGPLWPYRYRIIRSCGCSAAGPGRTSYYHVLSDAISLSDQLGTSYQDLDLRCESQAPRGPFRC